MEQFGALSLKIEYVPTDSLIPYGNNAKLHPDEQIEQIKESIRQFGFDDPIGVWRNNEIIEGHGRLIAAAQLGMETVPIIRLDHLTDAERKAYALAHNKTTMNSGFDLAILESEIESLAPVIDMSALGFEPTFEDIGGAFGSDNEHLREQTFEGAKEGNKVVCPACGFEFETL